MVPPLDIMLKTASSKFKVLEELNAHSEGHVELELAIEDLSTKGVGSKLVARVMGRSALHSTTLLGRR